MSQLRSFSIIGDSNVRRHLQASTTTQGRPLQSNAQFIPGGGRLSVLASALLSVRTESDACIVACITNILTGTPSASSLSLRLEPVMRSFMEKVIEFAKSRPTLQVFICPPMFRLTPIWYRDGMTEVMLKFSSVARAFHLPNVWLMPSFPKPRLETDGVHLDPFSGLEYILHLFDASQGLILTSQLPTDARLDCMTEASRSLEDRVHVIEQDHAQLRRSFEHQSAVAAELFDYEANIRSEVFFKISGLPRFPKLDQKEWQVRAVADVNSVISTMGFTFEAQYVQNMTGRGSDSRTLYKVRVATSDLSKSVRDKFSSYFAGGQDARPSSFNQLSIRNCVTPGTLARIAILQLLAKRYRESNPGGRAHVVAYEPRPLLKLTPPPEATDRRVMTMNFIEAISKLPTAFTSDETKGLLKRISPSLHGSLKSTLVVLTDDMLKKKSVTKRKGSKGTAAAAAKTTSDLTSGSESSEFRTPEAAPNGRKRVRAATGSGPSAKK